MNLPGVEPVPTMTEAERRKFSDFIESEFGIKMPANKKTLLEGRLPGASRSAVWLRTGSTSTS